MANVVMALVWLKFSNSLSGTACKLKGTFFPGHGGHPVLFHSDMGSFIPFMRPGVLLFVHELLHAFVVHSFPKQVARRDSLFGTHNLFQFPMVLLGLETDPSIRPVDIFSSQERHGKLNDNGMRIRRDDVIALSSIQYGQGHQRGIPLIAW